MGFFDRLSRLLRANLNELVSKAEDPAKILDQSVADMQSDLVRLRQAVAIAIASQKRMQSQAEQAETQAKTWYERAGIALQKGEEGLAREALSRRKAFQDSATGLNRQLSSQSNQVDILKQNLLVLEGKIAEAKTKKNMLKARAEAAQAQQQLQSAVGSLGNNTSMAAFERMEEQVEALEATSQATAELAGVNLESRFAILEGDTSGDVEDELSALKNRIAGKPEKMALPSTDWPTQKLKSINGNGKNSDLEEFSRSVDNP
uniref:Chloroplast membrane-associated 30 kD protein-like protein n=1 Tax=Paulinella longichromatophora TaxID=1708747 RepID=A0A2H4ZQH5_9EUKA|nr:chloroplast membrane-associated 30 kD protein-like protein [Paulinella longichromatophora]